MLTLKSLLSLSLPTPIHIVKVKKLVPFKANLSEDLKGVRGKPGNDVKRDSVVINP